MDSVGLPAAAVVPVACVLLLVPCLLACSAAAPAAGVLAAPEMVLTLLPSCCAGLTAFDHLQW